MPHNSLNTNIPGGQPHPWFAAHVRSRSELAASTALRAKGCETFLPLIRTRRQWSDRVKTIDTPLFPGYVFCRFAPHKRIAVLECRGVVNIVGISGHPSPIPDHEIESVRATLGSNLPLQSHPYLETGQRIRVEYGPLAGVEGVVVQRKCDLRLVVSVTLLQRSVSVQMDRAWVRMLPDVPSRSSCPTPAGNPARGAV
jgi:transcription antitermination factor NusG